MITKFLDLVNISETAGLILDSYGGKHCSILTFAYSSNTYWTAENIRLTYLLLPHRPVSTTVRKHHGLLCQSLHIETAGTTRWLTCDVDRETDRIAGAVVSELIRVVRLCRLRFLSDRSLAAKIRGF